MTKKEVKQNWFYDNFVWLAIVVLLLIFTVIDSPTTNTINPPTKYDYQSTSSSNTFDKIRVTLALLCVICRYLLCLTTRFRSYFIE